MRTYTRTSRAAANLLLLLFVALVYVVGRDSDLAAALIALVIAGAAIFYYGYFISSQHCAVCSESIVVPYSSYEPTMVFLALVAPFRVPLRCPHCGASTSWNTSHSEQK